MRFDALQKKMSNHKCLIHMNLIYYLMLNTHVCTCGNMHAHSLPHDTNIGGWKAGCVFPLDLKRACVILYKGAAERSPRAPTEKTMEQLEQQNKRG